MRISDWSSDVCSSDLTTTTAVITENAPCNSDSIYDDAIGDRKRTNVLVRVNNSFGDRFSVTATANYSHLRGVYRYGPAEINNVTVFGPGSGRDGQINPFYMAPAGATPAVSEPQNCSPTRHGKEQ